MSLFRIIKQNTDYRRKNSLSNKFRQKRINEFESFINNNYREKVDNNERITILDVGGRYDYWKSMEFRYEHLCDFVLANLEQIDIPDDAHNYQYVIADGRSLAQYTSDCFDVAYSNSTIEHVGGKPEWKKMAAEMQRVGKHYFCQTPNKFFPIEPHFLFPFFQFLPLSLRSKMIYKHQLGSTRRGRDYKDSLAIAEGIKLLSFSDLKQLFPDATIKRERFFGLTKSFMVYK